VLLGSFNDYERADNDRGYTLKTAIARLRSATKVPLLTGLPFGHVRTKVTLPVGRQARLLVDGRDVLVGWSG
jgi:muramoyltetrapeptide carboxypeptidase